MLIGPSVHISGKPRLFPTDAGLFHVLLQANFNVTVNDSQARVRRVTARIYNTCSGIAFRFLSSFSRKLNIKPIPTTSRARKTGPNTSATSDFIKKPLRRHPSTNSPTAAANNADNGDNLSHVHTTDARLPHRPAPLRPTFSATYILRSRPYLTPTQLTALTPPTTSTITSLLTTAITFLQSISTTLQFPVRTLCTSLLLLHRLLLHHPTPHLLAAADSAAACLFVASKIEDTLKKSREILAAAWTLKHGGVEMDSSSLDEAQRRVLGVERLVLESVGFDFRVRHAQGFVVKFCRVLGVDKELGRRAWEVSVDAYKTRAALMAAPHVLGLASVVLAGRMEGKEVEVGDWRRFECDQTAVLAVVDEVLDLWTVMPEVSRLAERYGNARILEERIGLNRQRSKANGSGVGEKGEATLERSIERKGGCTVRFMIDPERERREWELLEVGISAGRARGGEMGKMKMEE